jgi:hypothetical protein
MIKELGHTRIATAGRPVRHKQFSKSGEFLGYHEYDVIFETHQVDGRKLNLVNNIFAVRCWCTTTNNEHWLWIDRQYSDDPLEAIARTFFVHENLIPFIKELKRQGEIVQGYAIVEDGPGEKIQYYWVEGTDGKVYDVCFEFARLNNPVVENIKYVLSKEIWAAAEFDKDDHAQEMFKLYQHEPSKFWKIVPRLNS